MKEQEPSVPNSDPETLRNEERFRSYFEMGVVGIAVTSPEKGLFQYNDKLCEILGYSREELARKNWAELTHPEDLPLDATQFQRVLAGELEGYEVEKRFIRKDGTVVHVHVAGKCLRASGSKSPALVAMIQDITARKMAEEALRKSEERFDLAVRGSSDGIWDWDIRTNVAYHSPRIRELLGFAKEEFPDTREAFHAHLHPDDREPTWAAVRAHLEKRVVYDTEYRLRTKTGDYRWFRARGQAVWDAQGNAVRMAGSITDIHDHLEAERALRQAQAQALVAQEEFTQRLIFAQESERRRLADELHDSLGQRLSLIKNRAHLALDHADVLGKSAEHLWGITELVSESIRELRELTQNLRPLKLERSGLTESLVSMAEQVAQSSRIQFKTRFENVDDLFQGPSAMMIYRIVQEALNNIIKHSGAASATIAIERDLRCVRITVEDDGRGFEGPIVSIKPRNSSGIGLSSIKERARMLGGVMSIRSAPGKGTELSVEVPVLESSAISPPEFDGETRTADNV